MTSEFEPVKINVAVFGLGRSGLAVVRAARKFGCAVTVFDETSRDQIPKPELIEEAEAAGATLILGFPFPHHLPEFQSVVVNPAIDMRHPALQSLHSRFVDEVARIRSGGPEYLPPSLTNVISEIEFASGISQAPVIGITGTNGKSTTTAMTVIALRAAGKDAVLCGNIFGSGLPEQPFTEAAMNSTPDQILVAEISSFQLEWVSGFRPIAAAITSLSPDHQNRYDSYEQYCNTKLRIFRYQFEGDLAIVPQGVELDTEAQAREIGIDIRVESGKLWIEDEIFDTSEFKILGEHNWLNAGVAARLAQRALGEEAINPKVMEALREFKGLTHRMEFVAEHRGVRFINNSMCTNPAAVIASLTNIGAKTHVLVGGLNKDLHFEALGEFLRDNHHEAYLFGKDAEQISRELKGNYPIWSTMKEAFDAATQGAKEGEIVMLAPGCASSDQFSDFRHRGDVFKSYVTDWTA